MKKEKSLAEKINEAAIKASKKEVEKHHKAGRKVAIWKNGKIEFV